MGKIAATADWKLSYKVFNAWKRVGNVEKIQREQEIYQKKIQYENIKSVHASNFYKDRLLKKYLECWTRFVRESIAKKKLDDEKAQTKKRMEKFLEAAVQGKLWQEEPEECKEIKEDKKTVKGKIPVQRKTRMLSGGDDSESDTAVVVVDLEKKVKNLMLPFVGMKSAQGSSGFDSRFKAQEKMLREQHEMIREQQKLIEEMKFQQNQAAFKEQISLLEEIKTKQVELERMQKIQYQQERKLLKQQADLLKQKRGKQKRPENKAENSVEDVSSGDESLKGCLDSPKAVVSSTRDNENQLSARSQTNAISQRSVIEICIFV